MNEHKAVLNGIRIVEMDAIGPVPVASMILADMGADIIRIARPVGQGAWGDVGGAVLHRNRDVVHLDLKSAEDLVVARDLVAAADAVIEGFRPGVMERLGLGPDVLLASNPALVYVRVTGWGQDGPLAQRAGHDLNYIALTGVLRAMGQPGMPPPVPLNMVGDYAGGTMFAVSGLLAALLSARMTGRGRVVDVAMTDAVIALSAFFLGYRASDLWSDERGSNLLDGAAPFYRCYPCSDGEFVAVGALEAQFFGLLLEGLGLSDAGFAQMDRNCWPRMAADFAERFASAPRDHWANVFGSTDACVAPVLGFDEASRHPHNLARASFIDARGHLEPGSAPRFSGSVPATPRGSEVVDPAATIARWNGVSRSLETS